MLDPTRVSDLLGVPVEKITDRGSSHSWTLHHVRLADGREVFVKAAHDQAGVFAAEAAGLRWLAEAEGGQGVPVAGRGVPVAGVLAADDHHLILPWLPAEPPGPTAAERFGRELAALHKASPPTAYGASWPGYIADLPLDNTLTDAESGDAWPRWYAERRLAPFLARASGHLSGPDVALVERVITEIDDLAGPPEPPSRIHGDLWSGNVLWSGGRGWLIDPAAHGGHRETDLAMLALFGAPHLSQVLGAYDEVAPLAAGWRERVPLHQLHPLLVHVALFGGSYRSAMVEAARAALG
ncbi:fructosamine kinase family protein [Actinomadura fulvescens]|uniref:Fructosamine kinase family protein n=1 Tax=Actinomadura fulvescens TaxID=46160 RepID=A0ABP6C8H5_9ACTN